MGVSVGGQKGCGERHMLLTVALSSDEVYVCTLLCECSGMEKSNLTSINFNLWMEVKNEKKTSQSLKNVFLIKMKNTK